MKENALAMAIHELHENNKDKCQCNVFETQYESGKHWNSHKDSVLRAFFFFSSIAAAFAPKWKTEWKEISFGEKETAECVAATKANEIRNLWI